MQSSTSGDEISQSEGYTCDSDRTWIEQYTLGTRGHEMLLQVPTTFIDSDFNRFGIDRELGCSKDKFDDALDLIMDYDREDYNKLRSLQWLAEKIYALLH